MRHTRAAAAYGDACIATCSSYVKSRRSITSLFFSFVLVSFCSGRCAVVKVTKRVHGSRAYIYMHVDDSAYYKVPLRDVCDVKSRG